MPFQSTHPARGATFNLGHNFGLLYVISIHAPREGCDLSLIHICLERDSQLLMPVYDYCMPEKECTCGGCEDDPCEIFRHVKFPVNEFFPPNSPAPIPETCRELKGCCG